jgi:hypothetical protein
MDGPAHKGAAFVVDAAHKLANYNTVILILRLRPRRLFKNHNE